MKFEYYQDTQGEWRWRLKGRNGEIVAQSEGYRNLQSCLDTIKLIRFSAQYATVEEVPE